MYMIWILVGINLFVLGYGLCYFQHKDILLPKAPPPPTPTPVKEMTQQEKEFLEAEKRRLADSNAAFQTLMGYNSAIAYGIVPKRGDR